MLIRETDRAAGELGLAGQRVLVAVSGGVDSTVLAHALAEIARMRRFELAIAHVNHGLRGEESDADEQAVRSLACALGVPVEVEAGDPRALRQGRTSRERPTLQEAARAVRYAALYRVAQRLGATRIATAHTADDQAETLLLRLLRGAGPDGLGGIPERSPDGVLARPFLRVARATIESFATARGIPWREDASNGSATYARNRLRLAWLPALAREFNPQLLRVLADLAEAHRRDAEWIDAQVQREAAVRFMSDGKWLRIDVEDWSALPEALSRRLARQALRQAGAVRDVSRTHLQRFCEFLRQARIGAVIELPGGLRLERDAEGCRLGCPDGPACGGVESLPAC